MSTFNLRRQEKTANLYAYGLCIERVYPLSSPYVVIAVSLSLEWIASRRGFHRLIDEVSDDDEKNSGNADGHGFDVTVLLFRRALVLPSVDKQPASVAYGLHRICEIGK